MVSKSMELRNQTQSRKIQSLSRSSKISTCAPVDVTAITAVSNAERCFSFRIVKNMVISFPNVSRIIGASFSTGGSALFGQTWDAKFGSTQNRRVGA